MVALFLIAAIFILYTYAGYPLLLKFRKSCSPPMSASSEDLPEVSLVIPVYNEEALLREKIENSLRLDYPEGKLKIVVVLDGSTDRSSVISRSFPAITVLEYPSHRGKMSVLNQAVSSLSPELVAFTDVSAVWREDALRELVASLADPSVGAVSGELILQEEETRRGEVRVDWYWKMEKYIRKEESRIFSCLGATGAIYALRRKLFRPLPEDTILDDMLIPLEGLKEGYRIIFNPRARAYENKLTRPRDEFRRKVRTLYGNYQIFTRAPWTIVPGRSRMAFEMVSHKLFRLLVPLALIPLFFSCWIGPPLLRWFFYPQLFFYLLAAAGWLGGRGFRKLKFFSLPFTFCLLNAAALAAFIRFARAKPPPWR